jgi:hypothetical protein
MRIPIAVMSIPILALHGIANAGPVRACEQVSALIDKAVQPLLAGVGEPQPVATQLAAQFRACLTSRNICSVVYDTPHGREALAAGNTTGDLPTQYLPEQGKSPVMLMVRSIPSVPHDANQYCLVSEKPTAETPGQQWQVYGWVIAPNSSEVLPLPKQALPAPRSLRGLAVALWSFAERMSGRPPS